jgi:hypothetical protein
MTKGEYKVGITFNPSGDDIVGKIKRAAADLIDLIESIPASIRPDIEVPKQYHQADEVKRLKSLAQTEVESAAMWAVKAATKKAIE